MKRTAPLRRSKPIRKVSAKRARQLREYSARRIYYLRANPVCEVWLRENGWEPSASGIGIFYRNPAHFETCEDNKVQATIEEIIAWFNPPRATEIHHQSKRRGEMLNDERLWLAVCRENHERIENNKAWARAQGYLTNF